MMFAFVDFIDFVNFLHTIYEIKKKNIKNKNFYMNPRHLFEPHRHICSFIPQL